MKMIRAPNRLWTYGLKAIDNASTSVAAQAFSDELVVFKFREVLLPGIAFTVRCQFNP